MAPLNSIKCSSGWNISLLLLHSKLLQKLIHMKMQTMHFDQFMYFNSTFWCLILGGNYGIDPSLPYPELKIFSENSHPLPYHPTIPDQIILPILDHIIPSLTRSSHPPLTRSDHPPNPDQPTIPSVKSRLIFFRKQTIQTRHKWRFGILAGIKWYIYLFQEKKNWTKSYWREKTVQFGKVRREKFRR